MAAPHVSAVAALVLSVRPRFCPDTIASILFQTADDLGSPGWDQYYGYGLVNAYRAVRAVAPSTGPPPPTLPYRL
ncbi:MAG: peptidase S8, partial [Chloroflexota bacterium]